MEGYLAEVAGRLPGPDRAHGGIVAELRSGLLDAMAAYQSAGLPTDQAGGRRSASSAIPAGSSPHGNRETCSTKPSRAGPAPPGVRLQHNVPALGVHLGGDRPHPA